MSMLRDKPNVNTVKRRRKNVRSKNGSVSKLPVNHESLLYPLALQMLFSSAFQILQNGSLRNFCFQLEAALWNSETFWLHLGRKYYVRRLDIENRLILSL
ncbi:hypothetical protein IEQ34_017470 [Dendrobium chrysotoxum]|uniref:Uncharacterized protein n=1 Tax=Dendrobium chrysotoxum TaxID=161865 RepID=A0AAV7G9R1_DENCH|nr:hypothetical protein IEQ34_017470 [Dendrobium chrysotoxum]